MKTNIRSCHLVSQTTISDCRLKFRSLNGLRIFKNIINTCISCFKAQEVSPLTADLLKERLYISHAFRNVGIDFGGQFLKAFM